MVYKSIEDAVEAAKKNDQRAFGFLYDECWDYIYGYVFKISKEQGDPSFFERIRNKNFVEIFKNCLKKILS